MSGPFRFVVRQSMRTIQKRVGSRASQARDQRKDFSWKKWDRRTLLVIVRNDEPRPRYKDARCINVSLRSLPPSSSNRACAQIYFQINKLTEHSSETTKRCSQAALIQTSELRSRHSASPFLSIPLNTLLLIGLKNVDTTSARQMLPYHNTLEKWTARAQSSRPRLPNGSPRHDGGSVPRLQDALPHDLFFVNFVISCAMAAMSNFHENMRFEILQIS